MDILLNIAIRTVDPLVIGMFLFCVIFAFVFIAYIVLVNARMYSTYNKLQEAYTQIATMKMCNEEMLEIQKSVEDLTMLYGNIYKILDVKFENN